jgi:hypothetical protein
MRSIKYALQARKERRRLSRTTLPWAELEAEATRQGCSAADVFFDLAGRPAPELAAFAIALPQEEAQWEPAGSGSKTKRREEPCDIWGRSPMQRRAAYNAWGRRPMQRTAAYDTWGRPA